MVRSLRMKSLVLSFKRTHSQLSMSPVRYLHYHFILFHLRPSFTTERVLGWSSDAILKSLISDHRAHAVADECPHARGPGLAPRLLLHAQ